MSGDEKQTSWWSTLPGILTAIAAVITAVTGLVLGLGQLGVFDRQSAGDEADGVVTSTADPGAGSNTASDSATESTAATGSASAGAPQAASAWTVTLPEQRSYRSGDIEYTLLDASARPEIDDQLAMEITIRCTSYSRYGTNFWDANFRLNADGINIAPNSGLNEICEGDSSTTGVVRFVFPAEVRDPVLRMKFYEGESEAPLHVAPA